jgi:hypothetical protein
MRIKHPLTSAASCALLSLGLVGVATAADPVSPNDWAWRGTLYGWAPGLKTTTNFELPGGGNIIADSDSGDVLSHLKFAFMGTLEARRGPWSVLADAVYFDLGNEKSRVTSVSGPGGVIVVPIDAGTSTDLKGFVGTLEGGYAIWQTPGANMDVTGGVRYANVKATLDWHITGQTGDAGPTGSVGKSKDFVDGVVGVRGNYDLGNNWDVRYYGDVGAGSSRFTWQAYGAVGYRFGWGDVVLGYRHLAYDFRSDRPISDLKLSGPLLGVGFKF